MRGDQRGARVVHSPFYLDISSCSGRRRYYRTLALAPGVSARRRPGLQRHNHGELTGSMAERIQRYRVDDFDNSLTADVRCVFSVDNRWYRIDLTDSNRERLTEALAPFIKVAEKLPHPPKGYHLTAQNAATDGEIREWARGQGLTVSDRGRVSQEIVAKYYQAH